MAEVLAAPSNKVSYLDTVREHFPSGVKALRACLQCRLIMEKKQFIDFGCPQCTDLRMKESETRVIGCTTQNFEGYIANIRPGGFATRYTGLENSMPGFYALTVRGEIPASILLGQDEDFAADVADQLEDAMWGAGQAVPRQPKRRRTGKVGPAPPSVDSTMSSGETSEQDTTRIAKALAFVDTDGEAHKKDASIAASGSESQREQVVVSGSDRESGKQAAATSASDTAPSDREKKSAAATSASAAESDKTGASRQTSKSGASGKTSASGRSGATGTSRGSVAILEPEQDIEFDGAPQ